MRPLLAMLALSFAVGAACVTPPPSHPAAQEMVAEAAPPSPLPETMSDPPWGGAIWLAGFWSWDGVAFAWIPGRWEQDHPGWRWMPHHWEPRAHRWHFVPGRWMASRLEQERP